MPWLLDAHAILSVSRPLRVLSRAARFARAPLTPHLCLQQQLAPCRVTAPVGILTAHSRALRAGAAGMGRRPLCRRGPRDGHQVLAVAQAGCNRWHERHQLCAPGQLCPRGELCRCELQQQPSCVAQRARSSLSLLTPAVISQQPLSLLTPTLFACTTGAKKKKKHPCHVGSDKFAVTVVLLMLSRRRFTNCC